MKNTLLVMLSLWVIMATSGCVAWRPVDIAHSDSALAQQQRTEQKVESDTVEVFIVDHPELDEQTKKDLRDGTVTIPVVLERMKKPK
jgi:hypothetical protein